MRFIQFLIEQQTKQYLHWHVISRSNTRSVSYAKKDMIRSLEREGAIIDKPSSDTPYGTAPKNIGRMVLDVKRYLKDGEDPKEVRTQITNAIRIIHPKAGRKFLGLKEE